MLHCQNDKDLYNDVYMFNWLYVVTSDHKNWLPKINVMVKPYVLFMYLRFIENTAIK